MPKIFPIVDNPVEKKKKEEEEEDENDMEEEEEEDDDNEDDDEEDDDEEDDDDDDDDESYDSEDSNNSDDSSYDRSLEGRVTPHVKTIVRTAQQMESDEHRKSLQRSKEILRISGKADKTDEEIEEETRSLAQKKIDSTTGMQQKLLALEESQRRKAVIEARSLFAEKSLKAKAKLELPSAEEEAAKRIADLHIEEDIQAKKDAEKRKLAIEEEKKEIYEAEVFKAKEMQNDYLKMRKLANQTYCIPALTKSEGQWRESTRLQAAEMAGIAGMGEMKRGSKFFDFPKTDDEIATATVAFFSLPNSKASTTGFLPWVKINEEMAVLVTALRVDLFPEFFDMSLADAKKTNKTLITSHSSETKLVSTSTVPSDTTDPTKTSNNHHHKQKQKKRKMKVKGARKHTTENKSEETTSSSTNNLKHTIKTTSKRKLKRSISSSAADVATKKKKIKKEGIGDVTINELKIEAQRQGATNAMLEIDGISFSRFAGVLHKLLRKDVDSPSLLNKVSTHPKVNLVIPRFKDYHPIASKWLPEYRHAMKLYTISVKSYDYLGQCELNPVKAVEHMEQLATDSPDQFARGALDAVQLDVSRLYKGRLVCAPEFSIACTRGSNETVRNQESVRTYLKWITNPLLSTDPVIDPNAEKGNNTHCVVS
jgi:hypothetical protein